MDLLNSRLFIQGNAGVKWKYFEFAVSAKFGYVNFHKTNNDIPTFNEHGLHELNYIIRQKSTLIGELFFTTRFGWKYVKLHCQFGLNSFEPRGAYGVFFWWRYWQCRSIYRFTQQNVGCV